MRVLRVVIIENKISSFREELTWGKQDLKELLGRFHGTVRQWKWFREVNRMRKIRYRTSEN